MSGPTGILVGGGAKQMHLLPKMANRHGLVAGATGTGKTVTLQILAEGLSKAGVPSFVADVKGDLSGIANPGKPHPKIDERIKKIGIEGYELQGSPVIFWDLYGEKGHPIRTTISDMGPLLLSRLLDLNPTQEAVLHIVFNVADDQGLLLLDLKDLQSMLVWASNNAKELSAQYGNVSKTSVGAIQRGLLVLDQAGGDQFFGEPALDLNDFMRTNRSGRGYVNILVADKLINNPKLYSTALLWVMSELFENLPEAGDLEKPKLVFFFDEAHLLFDDAPKALVDKVEQVARLIRSKAVGVYFVTQSPLDIPEDILGQLGNRVQHALRAFTPKDQKAVRAAAQTFRANPKLDTEEAITQLGVGEALVSTLGEKGSPSVVERVLIRPPESRMGPLTGAERQSVIADSPVGGRYDAAVDRESAYELLAKRAEKAAADKVEDAPAKAPAQRRSRGRQTVFESVTKSVLGTVGRELGRQLVRGLLGALKR